MTQKKIREILFLAVCVLCLTPFITPPLALFLGIIFSQTLGHPFLKQNSKATKLLLQFSVVGLGFGMNLYEAAKAGKEGLLFTCLSILTTLGLGLLIGKLLKIRRKTTLLISSGTAICGGSAIAAVAPVIDAQEEEVTVSLGTVFILNALALFIFPSIGHFFEMTQHEFGMWAAIAIHDTSSVVGAAKEFGEEALKVATTVKMERALWIIPMTFFGAFLYKKTSFVEGSESSPGEQESKKDKKTRIKIPYFILFFVVAMAINTFIPALSEANEYFVQLAKKGLTLTLFLIGSGLTKSSLKTVGVKPLILGVILWILISVVSLFIILQAS